MARAEAAARLHEHRIRELGGQLVREPGRRRADAALLEEAVREVLVAAARDRLRLGHEHDRLAEAIAIRGEDEVIEVGERDDQADVVHLHELREGGDVAGVVHGRHERTAVGVVERRREVADVRGDRRRARTAERGDDVDALARAREEDGRHWWLRVAGRQACGTWTPSLTSIRSPPWTSRWYWASSATR